MIKILSLGGNDYETITGIIDRRCVSGERVERMLFFAQKSKTDKSDRGVFDCRYIPD